MAEQVLTRQRILDVAEETLRRFGPGKATVVDVARALGVSHASVYKHFASKAELRDAVTRIWLARVNGPLEEIVNEDGPAADRLRRWLDKLISIKRSRAFDDPELFATYLSLAAESREVVREHLEDLTQQLGRIVRDGVATGEFTDSDPVAVGRAILSATARFQNPAHAADWRDPDIDAAFDDVWRLIINGLRARQEIACTLSEA